MPSQLHGATQDEAHIHISFTTGQNTSHLSQVCLIHCYITNKPSMYLSMQNNTCWYLIYIHCYITNKPSMYLSMQNNTCWYLIYIHCYITNKPSMYLSMQNNTFWYRVYIHCYIKNKISMYQSMQNNTFWYLIYIPWALTVGTCLHCQRLWEGWPILFCEPTQY